MVIVFLLCWSPYASLVVATMMGYAQVAISVKSLH
jgi:hypothetical protein